MLSKVTGKPASLYETRHVDWVPTQNLGYSTAKVTNEDLCRNKRAVNRGIKRARIEEIAKSCLHVGKEKVFAEVKSPAFTNGNKQLSAFDVEKTRKIANVRIHVEQIIGLQRKYKVLQSTLPLDLLISVDDSNMCYIDKIVHVCSCLTKICNSVIPFD